MQNHNIRYLQGDRHINDLRYCELTGIDPAFAGTPEVNRVFIAQNPEKNSQLVARKLAEHGIGEPYGEDTKPNTKPV